MEIWDLMSINYNTKIATEDLVLYLDAANKKSYSGTGAVWYDLSGRNNHGTIIGGGVTFSNDSFVFNGGLNSIECPTMAAMCGGTWSGYITMEMVMKIANPPTNTLMGYCGFTQASPLSAFKFMNSTRLFIDTYNTTSTRYNTSCSSAISYGTWYHVTAVYDGSTKGYQNGSLVHSSPAYAQSDISNLNFLIGNGMGYYNFMGSMVMVRLYNRALSTLEIKENFNALRYRFGL